MIPIGQSILSLVGPYGLILIEPYNRDYNGWVKGTSCIKEIEINYKSKPLYD